MSRAKSTEVTSPLSLFPFIGVLLSTMGALLVVLIAVSRSARDTALRDVAVHRETVQKTEASPATEDDRRKLKEIAEFSAQLTDVRARAASRLREDQLRLSHLEEQMRRLEDQMASLGMASSELEAMDKGHFDDRRQAEKEIERLQELVVDSRKTIKSLKSENSSKKRSFAIIPYEGRHGTHRRPIYIECRADAVVIQPEGIRFDVRDLLPPLDAGNPLAAALRAAREELVKNTGASAPTKQMEPYPLILIRPEGIKFYYMVREAIESWGADFGYEFVGSDWKLDFPPADPQLAKVEHQAVEQARDRRKFLAAAAPRAFRSGRFDVESVELQEDADGGPISDSRRRGGRSGRGEIGRGSIGIRSGNASSPRRGLGEVTIGSGSAAVGANGEGNAPSIGAAARSSDKQGISADGANGASAGMAGSQVPPGAPAGSAGTPGQGAALAAGPAPGGEAGLSVSNGSGPASASIASAPATDGNMGPAQSSASSLPTLAPSQVHELAATMTSQDIAQSRGANWALGYRGPAAVPVRRSIKVVLHDDHIEILPEAALTDQPSAGRDVPLTDSMATDVYDIVAAVQEHVSDWGIAGRGLYWRPVLVLHVGSGAERRATELTQLLKDSGIELRLSAATGQRGPKDPERR